MASDLTALHDIHLPAPIGWWPLAPGWYLLVASMVMTSFIFVFLIRRFYFNGRAKRAALHTLAAYERAYLLDKNGPVHSAAISALLKRVALAYYPRTDVAGLHGEAWITFLNGSVQGDNFNSVRTLLLELPYLSPGKGYRPSRIHNLAPLFNMARKWIKRQGKPCSN